MNISSSQVESIVRKIIGEMSSSPKASAGIPKTAKDISRSGTVVEVMSAIGYKLIRPAYYDVVLTSKTARDEEPVEMLDIIFSNIESDMAYMYGWGGYSDALISVMTGSSDIMSTLEAKRSATEEAIKTYMSEIK